MTRATLEKLGFSEKEAKIFEVVLQHRRITPAQVSKLTHISRPLIYHLARRLVANGLLAEDLGGKTLYLIPGTPEDVIQACKKEEQELRQREKLLHQVARELSLASVGAEYAVPKIRFVEEENLESHLYKRSKAWNESALTCDGRWWGFRDHSFVEHYRKWIDWFWATASEKIDLQLLSNRSQVEERMKGKHARRIIKFWEKGDNFTATTWVIGDYLVLVNTRTKPFYLTEIHDKLLAHNMREVFRKLWEEV